MSSNKFKTFRWGDFLGFAGPAIFTSIFTAYVMIQGVRGEGLALMGTVAIIMWLIYFSVLYFRNKELRKISYITRHNIAVITNNFNAKKEDVEFIIDNTIIDWNNATKWSGCTKALDGMFIIFKKYPVSLHSKEKSFAGYIIGKNAVIGYKDDLSKTALAHEIGHKIHEKWTGHANNENCHKFMKENNLK